MKKLLLVLFALACQAQQVTLLQNGWATSTVVPSNCTTGISPTFLQAGTNTIFVCSENKYVQAEQGWRKYNLLAIANGTNGCASVNGCWQINGTLGAIKNPGLTQQIALFNLPNNTYVSAVAAKTKTACTGPATAVISDIGNATSASKFITGLTYDIKAAVSTANALYPVLTGVGNNDLAIQSFTITITDTVNNVSTIVAGCSIDIFVKWEVLPF